MAKAKRGAPGARGEDLTRTMTAWGESLVALAPTSKRAIVLELRGEKDWRWSSLPWRRGDVPLLHVSGDAEKVRAALGAGGELGDVLRAAGVRVRGDVTFMARAIPILTRRLAEARRAAR